MSRFLYLIAGLLLVIVLNTMCNTDKIVSDLDVKLKVVCQTKDSLRISVTYLNETPKRIALQSITEVVFDGGEAQQDFENKGVDDIGNVADTIKLVLPCMKKELQYQRMNNGDTLDIFDCLSSMSTIVHIDYDAKVVPPTPPVSWKEGCSEWFLDKDLFNVVWNDSISFPHEDFLDSEAGCWCRAVIIEPFASKEIIFDMSYLLKRKATYMLQVDGFSTLSEDQEKCLNKLSEKYGYVPYKGRLFSKPITIFSE